MSFGVVAFWNNCSRGSFPRVIMSNRIVAPGVVAPE